MAKLIAIALLVVGVVLIVLGFQEYGAFSSKLAKALGKGLSKEVIMYIAGGGVCAFLGLAGLLKKKK